MAEPLEAALPLVELTNGATIVFEPIDPTTGNTVLGVTVSAVAVYGESSSGGGLDTFDAPGPLWVPLPANVFAAG